MASPCECLIQKTNLADVDGVKCVCSNSLNFCYRTGACRPVVYNIIRYDRRAKSKRSKDRVTLLDRVGLSACPRR